MSHGVAVAHLLEILRKCALGTLSNVSYQKDVIAKSSPPDMTRKKSKVRRETAKNVDELCGERDELASGFYTN